MARQGSGSEGYSPARTVGMPTSSRGSVPTRIVLLRKNSRDPQPVVEHERVIAGGVSGPSHLHDPQLPLHAELSVAGEAQVAACVREVFLLVLRVRRAGRAIRPHARRPPTE